jgi:hypothetical protein
MGPWWQGLAGLIARVLAERWLSRIKGEAGEQDDAEVDRRHQSNGGDISADDKGCGEDSSPDRNR